MAKTGDGRYIPQWAADDIARLEREKQYLEQRVEALEGALSGDGASAFSVNRGVSTEELSLPSDAHVLRVRLANGFELTFTPEQRGPGSVTHDKPNTVQVMVTSHHGLAVYPQSGNVVHLGPGKK
jgi:hypothetical protein